MFPYLTLLLAFHAVCSTKPHLLALQLPWLDAPQGQAQGVFHTFPRPQKSATVTSQSSANLGAHSSSSTSSAYGLRHWVDEDTGDVWTLLTDAAQGSWWLNLRTYHSQWHPPWER